METEFCGYVCAFEMKKLHELTDNLRKFYEYNPEYARRITNEMKKVLNDFDIEMYNKYENKFGNVE